MKVCRLGLALAVSCCNMGRGAPAEISDNVVRVGVLNDISGIFQDTNGMGSVEAARMAAEDFNGGGKGIKVEISTPITRTRPMSDRRSCANGLMSMASMRWLMCRIQPSASPSIRCCAIPAN